MRFRDIVFGTPPFQHTLPEPPGVPFLQPVSSADNFLPVTPALRRPLGAPSRFPGLFELTVAFLHH